MDQDVYCPMCGAARGPASACVCGHRFAGDEVVIEGKKIMGASPMMLPDRCVKCGRDASAGRRYDRTLYAYSPFIVLTILLGGIIGLVVLLALYYATRKPMQIGYSTCSECTSSRKVMVGVTWALWLLLVAALFGMVVSTTVFGIASALLFVAAITMSILASAPLRVAGFKNGVFTVRGAGQEFLDTQRLS